MLAIKRRLEQPSTTRFLIYSNQPEPDAANDWLLDVRLRSKPFRADQTTLLIEDLGLTSLTLAEYIRSRSKFLGAEARRSKLKRLVSPADGEAELEETYYYRLRDPQDGWVVHPDNNPPTSK